MLTVGLVRNLFISNASDFFSIFPFFCDSQERKKGKHLTTDNENICFKTSENQAFYFLPNEI